MLPLPSLVTATPIASMGELVDDASQESKPPTGKTLRSPGTKFPTQKRSADESHSSMPHELEPETLTDSQNTRQDRPAIRNLYRH